MAEWIFQLVLAWHAGLILLLLLYTARVQDDIRRLVGFDALSIAFVSALIIVGLHRQAPYYMDIALVVGMLGFVQTLAAVRYVERQRRVE